jgi:hypothetical protein
VKPFAKLVRKYWLKWLKRIQRRKKTQLLSLQEARRLYRQLLRNFDELQEYELSAACHISECEMAFKLSSPVLRHVTLNGLYKLASEYGENYRRAFCVLLIVIGASMLAFWLTHTSFVHAPEALGPIGKRLSLGQSIWMAIYAARPFNDLGLKPSSLPFWLAFAEGIVVPIQTALLLLAINRRFKRA